MPTTYETQRTGKKESLKKTKPTAIYKPFCYKKQLCFIGMWCITKGIFFCCLKIPSSSNSSTARLRGLNLQFGQFVRGWDHFVLWHRSRCSSLTHKNVSNRVLQTYEFGNISKNSFEDYRQNSIIKWSMSCFIFKKRVSQISW